MPKTIIGTGLTAVFGTSSFAINIDSISPASATREAINTSHMGTTNAHTFKPSKLVDWGEINIEGHFDPDVTPPMTGAAETLTITLPLESGESTPADWEYSVFMTGFDATVTNEEKATCSVRCKITGAPTVTAGS